MEDNRVDIICNDLRHQMQEEEIRREYRLKALYVVLAVVLFLTIYCLLTAYGLV